MLTSVYVDGFNLYNRRLKREPRFKWLNLRKLAENVLRAPHVVDRVCYYTARVSPVIDAAAPARQQAYMKALRSAANVEIFEGTFALSKAWAFLAEPPLAKPDEFVWPEPGPACVQVKVAREKGSDVNLAAHLVRDGFQGRYEAAVVISSDSDLAEPIRIVREELGKVIGVIRPTRKPSGSLAAAATFCIGFQDSALAKSQFADAIDLASGERLARPEGWHRG